MLGIYDRSTRLGIDDVISTQCVNYRTCGSNVALITHPRTLGLPGIDITQDVEVQVFRQTCPCFYSQDDLSLLGREIALGKVHP
jgi:hypothetical protein